MMLPLKEVVLHYDLNEVIRRFCELTGWSSAQSGLWTADFSKQVVFEIRYDEGRTYQHEQDYVFLFVPSSEYYIPFTVAEVEKKYLDELLIDSKVYNNALYYRIYFSSIVAYLIYKQELPQGNTLLITNLY
jgi:hypothetical protein